MSGLYRGYTVVCDTCKWHLVLDLHYHCDVTKQDAATMAHNLGWRKTESGWICPECSGEKAQCPICLGHGALSYSIRGGASHAAELCPACDGEGKVSIPAFDAVAHQEMNYCPWCFNLLSRPGELCRHCGNQEDMSDEALEDRMLQQSGY